MQSDIRDRIGYCSPRTGSVAEVILRVARMKDSASTDITDTRPVKRHVERWLVGLAMTVLAYLMEQAMLRSIKRSGTKPS